MVKIGFIGSGKMAFALMQGIKKGNLSYNIIANDHNIEKMQEIKKELSIEIATDNKEVAQKSDILFLCVKPQDMEALLEEINYSTNERQIIVSIAAGIKLDFYESKLKNRKIIRVMPNTPCLVGEMAAGYSLGQNVRKENAKIVEEILNSTGKAYLLDENQLDAVTALSGSGPAFFAFFIDTFVESAAKEGLNKETAFKLACQTALGTAKLLMEKNMTPQELINMVASPKGTTAAGLKVLEEGKVKEILMECIKAAAKRSRELGKRR